MRKQSPGSAWEPWSEESFGGENLERAQCNGAEDRSLDRVVSTLVYCFYHLKRLLTVFIGPIGLRLLFFQWNLTKLSSSSSLFSYTLDSPAAFLRGLPFVSGGIQLHAAAVVDNGAPQLVDFLGNSCTRSLQMFPSPASPPQHALFKSKIMEKTCRQC